jgi:hypothetical protein
MLGSLEQSSFRNLAEIKGLVAARVSCLGFSLMDTAAMSLILSPVLIG